MKIGNVIEENIIDTLTKNYMPYTAYVITERALPEIDGFKPSQRRILYTMMKMGLLKGNRKKSQGVVGQTMFLHPHGDGAIYETMVRMSRDAESLTIPFIDSKGNFGKQYSRDMMYASARYTEARLMNVAKELFQDIDKNTVDMVENYDGTLKEPKLLPVTFPFILTNPQSGIANGMASNIAPFNLSEVADYVVAYLKNPRETKVEDYIIAPDFSTGGDIIYNKEAFQNIFENGRGSFNIRATYRFEGNSIIFEKLPYTTTFEVIMDKISNLVKEGKIKDIIDIHDNYGIGSEGIEVVTKNNTNKELLVEKLFKMTPLQASFGCNFNLIIDGRPKVLGVKAIVHEWLGFRANAIKRGAKFDMDKKEHKKHMLLALKQVLLDIDKAIAIIRETKKNSEVVENLMKTFSIDEEQAEFVSDIKLRQLNKEYLLNRIDEIKVLEEEILELNELITDRKKLASLIINQIKKVKKEYGSERKTNLINESEIKKVATEEITVDNYNVKVFVSKEGYLKKIPLTSLRGAFAIKVKEDDSLVGEFETTNNSDILVFTDKQNVYKIKSYELEDHKPSALGEYLPSYLNLKGESILYVTVTKDYTGNLIVGFEDGKVAKIDMVVYETKQNRSMLKNAYANKKALYMNHIYEDVDILAVSSIKKALVFNTGMVGSKTTKVAQGNQAMKEKNGSTVVSYRTLTGDYPESDYYRTSNAGIGKYLKEEDFKDLL